MRRGATRRLGRRAICELWARRCDPFCSVARGAREVVPFETVDILQDEGLRAGMKIYSQWPTFPQVYIDGEFYGGCDICIDGYKDGSLVEAVEAAMAS